MPLLSSATARAIYTIYLYQVLRKLILYIISFFYILLGLKSLLESRLFLFEKGLKVPLRPLSSRGPGQEASELPPSDKHWLNYQIFYQYYMRLQKARHFLNFNIVVILAGSWTLHIFLIFKLFSLTSTSNSYFEYCKISSPVCSTVAYCTQSMGQHGIQHITLCINSYPSCSY